MLLLSLSFCLLEVMNDNMFTLLPFSDKSCGDVSVMHFSTFEETLLLKNMYIFRQGYSPQTSPAEVCHPGL